MANAIEEKGTLWCESKRAAAAKLGWTRRGLRAYAGSLGLEEIEFKNRLLSAYDEWASTGKRGGSFRVLDLGAGEGRAADELGAFLRSKKRREASVTRLNYLPSDFNGSRAGVAGDAAALPFKSGSFELVLSSGALPYLRDKPAALREVNRVLSRHGRALVQVLHPEQRETVSEAGLEAPLVDWLAGKGGEKFNDIALQLFKTRLPETRPRRKTIMEKIGLKRAPVVHEVTE